MVENHISDVVDVATRYVQPVPVCHRLLVLVRKNRRGKERKLFFSFFPNEEKITRKKRHSHFGAFRLCVGEKLEGKMFFLALFPVRVCWWSVATRRWENKNATAVVEKIKIGEVFHCCSVVFLNLLLSKISFPSKTRVLRLCGC